LFWSPTRIQIAYWRSVFGRRERTQSVISGSSTRVFAKLWSPCSRPNRLSVRSRSIPQPATRSPQAKPPEPATNASMTYSPHFLRSCGVLLLRYSQAIACANSLARALGSFIPMFPPAFCVNLSGHVWVGRSERGAALHPRWMFHQREVNATLRKPQDSTAKN